MRISVLVPDPKARRNRPLVPTEGVCTSIRSQNYGMLIACRIRDISLLLFLQED